MHRGRSFDARQAFVMGSKDRPLPVPVQFGHYSVSEARELYSTAACSFLALAFKVPLS
jgi:hypothetical protein